MKSRDLAIILIVTGAVVIAFCGLFGVLVVLGDNNARTSRADPVEEQNRDAWFECKVEASGMLKNPGSADFPWFEDVSISRTPQGVIIMRSYVDATNGFGAVVRTPFVCEAKRVGITYIATVELLE